MAFPNYSENVPQMSDVNWKSNPNFTYSLLSGVYKAAERNLHAIFPNIEDIEECKINEDDLFDFQCTDGVDVGTIFDEFSGVAAYTIFWLIFGFIFTTVGIVWCFCNNCCCCCRSVNRNTTEHLGSTDDNVEDYNSSSDEPSKFNKYYRILVAVLMALWILGFSFSVFTSFASNESLRKSIAEFQDDVVQPLDDAESYLNITKRQVEAVFITSYGNLSDRIREIPSGPSYIYSEERGMDKVQQLVEIINVFLLTTGKNQKELNDTVNLKMNEFNHRLISIKSSLEIKVTPLLNQIDKHIKISRSFEEGIRITGEQLEQNSLDLIQALDEVPIADTRRDIDDVNTNVLDIVGRSVYGVFMTFNIVILAILFGIIMGYVVTLIGPGAAKNTGFIFYRFTITTMFTIGWFVTIAMLIGFSTAGFFSQFACETAKDLENRVTYNNPDIEISMSTNSPNLGVFQATNMAYDVPGYGHITRSCKQDKSAYIAMKLEQVYDIESIRDISNNFETGMTSAVKLTDKFLIKNIQIVYSTLEKELIGFQESGIELFNFSPFVLVNSKSQIYSLKLNEIYSRTENLLISVLEDLQALQSTDVLQSGINQMVTVLNLINNYEEFVYNEIRDNIGKCRPIYEALDAAIHTFCYKVIAPVATYWWSLQFLLIMFVAVIVTAFIKERLFQ